MVAEPTTPDPQSITGRQLFVWMFSFLRPVKAQVAMAAFYLAAVCGVEILTVNQSGHAIDDLKALSAARDVQAAAGRPVHTFYEFLTAADPATLALRGTIYGFVLLTGALLLLRY